MDIIRDPEGPILLGDPTITQGRPCYDNGEAIPVADVSTIQVFAFTPGEPVPFWILDLTVADVLSDTASTEGWVADDIGWTFRHELLYGADEYFPPLGRVEIEYLFTLVSGARKTVVREVDYAPGRAISGGNVEL